jgi:hypothetical protein
MPAHLHRLEGAQTEWKAAWWSVPVLLYALFFLLYALFVLADQDCGRCKYVLRTANLCTTFLCFTPSLVNSREAANSVWSAQTALIFYDYITLYHYYITLYHCYSNYFLIIAIITNKIIIALLQNKNDDLGWNSLQKSGALRVLEASPPRSAFVDRIPCCRFRGRQGLKGSLLGARRHVDGCLHGPENI